MKRYFVLLPATMGLLFSSHVFATKMSLECNTLYQQNDVTVWRIVPKVPTDRIWVYHTTFTNGGKTIESCGGCNKNDTNNDTIPCTDMDGCAGILLPNPEKCDFVITKTTASKGNNDH